MSVGYVCDRGVIADADRYSRGLSCYPWVECAWCVFMHIRARHIDNLLVVLGVAAVAGYSMIVDGHCGHWWYDRSTSAASLQ